MTQERSGKKSFSSQRQSVGYPFEWIVDNQTPSNDCSGMDVNVGTRRKNVVGSFLGAFLQPSIGQGAYCFDAFDAVRGA